MKRAVFVLLILNAFIDLFAQEIDSIIDIREKQVYKIVKIGQQWWMQEYLNVGTRILGSQAFSDNGIIEKYCYSDLESNCEIYGGIYKWDEMMDYNPSDGGNPGITQGICPVDWHLPTDNEWTELTDFLGGVAVAGAKMKDISFGTGATNESHFSALPGGYCFQNGDFTSMGSHATFWSSTEEGASNSWSRNLYGSTAGVERTDFFAKNYGLSVRCLRDTCQFSYLTLSYANFISVSDLKFYGNNISQKLILMNSSAGKTIIISSINTKNSAFNTDKETLILSPGDTAHLTLSFNPPEKGMYTDTIQIVSDDPYKPIISIPLQGYHYTNAPCGILAENTTLIEEESPYLLDCNLTIANGTTLTIEPGVTLLIDSMRRITVDGTMISLGNEDNPIVFTGKTEDKFDQIYLSPLGFIDINHTTIENAETGFRIGSDTVHLRGCKIMNCSKGIYVQNGNCGLLLDSSEISYCSVAALYVDNLQYNKEFNIFSSHIHHNQIGLKTRNKANIRHCLIEYNEAEGIYLGSYGENTFIENNNIHHNQVGIRDEILGKIFIRNNIVTDNSNGGIICSLDYWPVIEKNIIHGNGDYGISIGNGDVLNNSIIGNAGSGIRVEIGSNIKGNLIRNNAEDGLVIIGINDCIEQNDITQNSGDGIELHGIPKILSNNNIYNNSGFNINAQKSGFEAVNAENNYWGFITPAEIRNTIYDYYDDGTSVIVDFEPFLTEKITPTFIDFARNDTACYGDAVPPLIAIGDSIRWYDDAEFSNLIYAGDTLETGKTVPGVYVFYVSQTLNDSTVYLDTAALVISTIPIINSIDKSNESGCHTTDGSVTVHASDLYSLQYSIDGGTSYHDNNGNFTGLKNGNYPVSIVNRYGCETTGNTIEIISNGILPPAPATGGDSIYCPGKSIQSLTAQPSTGGTITWYQDPGLTGIMGVGNHFTPAGVINTTTYYVTETNGDCESPASPVTIGIRNIVPFEDEELCLITIDLNTGKNSLVWEKTPGEGTVSYNIYRETSVISQYEVIGSVPFNQLSVFTDSTAKPEERQYLYKITAVDSCGNESGKSPYHKPLFLQYVGSTGGVNLQWSDYEIEGGDISFVTYEIYRGADPSSLEKIADVSASLDRFTDTYSEAINKKVYYRIAGVKSDPCYPTVNLKGINIDYTRSMSNLENNHYEVTNENHSPTNILLDNSTIDENESIGSLIGRFSTTDSDPGDIHIYTFASGTGDVDNSYFIIMGDSLLSGGKFDYETKNIYNIRVRTTDTGSLYFEKQITININDVSEPAANQPPTDISLDNNTINENEPSGSLVGRFTTTDTDMGDTHTYSLFAGTGDDDNSDFTIKNDSLLTSAIFDYETKNSYSTRIKTTDSGEGNLSFEKSFIITVNDIVEVGLYQISGKEVGIYPNPFNKSATLIFNNPEEYSYTLYIRDVTGKICFIIDDINTSEHVLEKGNLKEGFYFVELRGPKIYRGKIVIE